MKLKLKNKDTVIILVLVLLIVATKFGIAVNKDNIEINLADNQSTIDLEIEEEKIILVHISGEINKPGVYELDFDSRLDDLVKVSGGLTAKADVSRINLARLLNDGLKIHIPSENNITETPQLDGKLTLTDLNQLSAKELEIIDGVGEVISKRIVNYREENGSFTKISDLLKVNGIGESKLEQIKNNVY
ncbi:MAG TPA: helix-hairpin-helix domain-containing protein [Clostridia bacterium]|nr:helix-hairpin-helix domain-containing protein [Clostridia bacterium]